MGDLFYPRIGVLFSLFADSVGLVLNILHASSLLQARFPILLWLDKMQK